MKVDSDCKDLKGNGKTCVKSCVERMIAAAVKSPTLCEQHQRCPILWRRYLGSKFCARDSCVADMTHRCGKQRYEILKGRKLAEPKKVVWYSACRLCMHDFIWATPHVVDYGCWIKHEKVFCKPDTSSGSIYAHFAAIGIDVQMKWGAGDQLDVNQPSQNEILESLRSPTKVISESWDQPNDLNRKGGHIGKQNERKNRPAHVGVRIMKRMHPES